MRGPTVPARAGWKAFCANGVHGASRTCLTVISGVAVIDVGGEFKSLKLEVLHKTELSPEEGKCRYQGERQHGVQQRLETESWQQHCGNLGMNRAAQLSLWESELEKVLRSRRKREGTRNPNALQNWRREQSLVLSVQRGHLPAPSDELALPSSSSACRARLSASLSCSPFMLEFCTVYLQRKQGFFRCTSSSVVRPVSSAQGGCQIQHLCPAWSGIWGYLLISESGHRPAASACCCVSSEQFSAVLV